MNYSSLYRKNIRHFRRFYTLIAAASAIATAVLVGSLTVGDSVRNTLTARVAERLGNTQTVVFARSAFLDTAILHTPLLNGCSARGVLLTNGFVSSSGRLLPVMVWGVNDMHLARGSAKINASLHRELSSGEAEIALRLPATGMVPSGSLFVTSSYTTSLRLTLAGVADVREGGNLSLKNEQTLPLNVFVNRDELAEAMGVEGKLNLVLAPQRIAPSAFDSAWCAAYSGLTVQHRADGVEVVSDRVFIQPEAVDSIVRCAPQSNRLLSYLVNSIAKEASPQANAGAMPSIPYSFVTAIEKYNGAALRSDEIILSDYAARRINATVGDEIRLTFFTSHDLKILRTDTVVLRVRRIVPLAELAADKGLSADFPGLADVESCTDWDSDLPIDMSRIAKEDERYWEVYRTTPKALVAYDAVASQWSNAYGSATAIRIADTAFQLSQCALTPSMLGVQLIAPRELGLQAAANGVDFSSLFLSLGIFIIIAAMLLLRTPIAEMLQLRSGEIALLQSLGWQRRRICRMLWREAAPVVALSSLAGVALGLLYTAAVMWLLGNVWRGATHTDGFALMPNVSTVMAGMLAGMILSAAVLWRAIARGYKNLHRAASSCSATLHRPSARFIAGASAISLCTAAIAIANIALLHSASLFVVVGVLLLVCAALWGQGFIAIRRSRKFSFNNLAFASLHASRRQQRLSFFTLASGVFIVFAVGLNRQGFGDSAQLATGTGGYSLWCESSVPIYHNISTPEGRAKLALQSLPSDAQALQMLRFSADNASCINLNKVTNPTVLGVDMPTVLRSDFRLAQTLYHDGAAQHLRRMDGQCIPALVDETVLMWSLMRKLGDTLYYSGSAGQRVMLRLVGTLQNSIFQGSVLIDKSLFSEAWSAIGGSEVALLKVRDSEIGNTKRLLETALSDYGVRVTTTAERLREFNSVTDSYLTIFMTLGGLGMLLGVFGFIIVVRKNLAARAREISIYRNLGFDRKKAARLLYRENIITPLYAVLAGFLCAIVGVSAVAANAGLELWLFAAVMLAAMCGMLVWFVRREARRAGGGTAL